ncbi:hypothetical protein HOLleu_35787 [Holothuria leucospilota]|uniref:Uncharacterized protein n=1 Tax=Holothuria leucospilota TaxID=206669 RepID=A0A9Q0YMI6_HOLLE|nr:hypothetical protein HOLleu_35787 [Holothuria leucospilota]
MANVADRFPLEELSSLRHRQVHLRKPLDTNHFVSRCNPNFMVAVNRIIIGTLNYTWIPHTTMRVYPDPGEAMDNRKRDRRRQLNSRTPAKLTSTRSSFVGKGDGCLPGWCTGAPPVEPPGLYSSDRRAVGVLPLGSYDDETSLGGAVSGNIDGGVAGFDVSSYLHRVPHVSGQAGEDDKVMAVVVWMVHG